MSTRRVLIVAKTYPELSSKYVETVCTAGIGEDGNPLRLYPIPFRYLSGDQRFKRYQWISASLTKNQNDLRPESFSVNVESIRLEEDVPPTADEWGRRADLVLKSADWQYSSMKRLLSDQKAKGTSLAFLKPTAINSVSLRTRAQVDEETFDQKLKRLKATNLISRSQLDLFESTMPARMKNLQYVGQRVCVDWTCSDEDCTGHSMQILDWEICELARNRGIDDAKAKVETLLNLDRYNTAFILGNIHMFPQSFAVIGLWYPLRSNRLF